MHCNPDSAVGSKCRAPSWSPGLGTCPWDGTLPSDVSYLPSVVSCLLENFSIWNPTMALSYLCSPDFPKSALCQLHLQPHREREGNCTHFDWNRTEVWNDAGTRGEGHRFLSNHWLAGPHSPQDSSEHSLAGFSWAPIDGGGVGVHLHYPAFHPSEHFSAD